MIKNKKDEKLKKMQKREPPKKGKAQSKADTKQGNFKRVQSIAKAAQGHPRKGVIQNVPKTKIQIRIYNVIKDTQRRQSKCTTHPNNPPHEKRFSFYH